VSKAPPVHFATATLPLASGHVLSYCCAFMSEAQTSAEADAVTCVTCRERGDAATMQESVAILKR
jgi:hypothetical protein